MSTIYNIINGDTLESIARKVYGSELYLDAIIQANPGLTDILIPGTSIVTPIIASAPKDIASTIPANNENEIAVIIDGKRFRFWDSLRVTRSIDNMDVVELGAPFEPDIPDFRKTFVPFSYKNMDVTIGGDPLFTGTIITVDPIVENNQRIVSVSGYALPGVLNDCTAPASSYPLEFNGQRLRDIAVKLAGMFGISVEFQADQGTVFDRVALEPGKKILSFLAELAKQRNLIISSTSRGTLLFWKSVEVGEPVARLQQGLPPVVSVVPSFNPQEYYSHVTGIEPVFLGLGGAQFTVKNDRLTGVIRPITFNVNDTEGGDVKTAVAAKMGRMFGNMASYAVSVATWRDSIGKLWQPNTTITLIAPGAMVYQEYEFVIRSVEFDKMDNAETATLNIVIPGSFSGKMPETLPWVE